MLGERIKAIWHDPVWSKVIAAGVLAALAGVWTFRAAIASAAASAMTSLAAARGWLAAPASVSHLLLIVMLVVLAVLAVRSWLISLAVNDITGILMEHIRRTRGGTAVEPEVEPEMAAKVAEGFEPNRLQLIAAKVLIDRYPKKLQLPDLAAAMQTLTGSYLPVAPQGEIAREMEAMERSDVAVIVEPESPLAYYGLTRHGRDFMIEKLRATQRPQPAVDPQRSALRALQDEEAKKKS